MCRKSRRPAPAKHRPHAQDRAPQAVLIERLRKHLPDRRTVGQEQAPRVGIKNCVPALESALVQRGVAEPRRPLIPAT